MSEPPTPYATTESIASPSPRPENPGCVLWVSEAPGPDRGRSLSLPRGRARVGSSSACELVLADSSISRQHVELSVRPDGILVQDLGSTNGTFYLGNRVDKIVLRHGARLQIGRCTVDLLPLSAGEDLPASMREGYGDLVGTALPMRRLYAMLERLEQSEVPVLIHGETGTGKELVARALHTHSRRKDAPLVTVDCGRVHGELINSELFGHKRGAFTGAVADRVGAFARGNGGTVFLDEIGELPLELQPKLLRVLETGEIHAMGETTPKQVDVRVIAATHRDLAQRVAEGAFREDLYYRLAVLTLHVPPLRERREDIPRLVEHLVRELAESGGAQLPDAAMEFLLRCEWPGNVRELRNAVQRLLVLGTHAMSAPQQAAPRLSSVADLGSATGEMSYRDARDVVMREFERAYLQSVLEKSDGNLSAAARTAGIDRKYFRELLKRHGLYT